MCTYSERAKPNHPRSKNPESHKMSAPLAFSFLISLFLIAGANALSLAMKRSFSGYFYTEILVGNPPVRVNLIIDTASSLPWLQGADCTKCTPVSLPTFNRNKSATYKPMPYSHPFCSTSPLFHLPGHQTCHYEIDYFGEQLEQQSTNGEFVFDTFTFQPWQQQEEEKIYNFAFGYGTENFFYPGPEGPDGNPISGILGLDGDHPASFMEQLSNVTLRRFSYCLPPYLAAGESTLLHLGNNAQLTGPKIQSTPILESQFGVQLEGISVNGRLLPIDSALFKAPFSGTYVDSGTLRSRLIAKAYGVVEAAVAGYLEKKYGWSPLDETRRFKDYQLCYEAQSGRGGKKGYEFPTLAITLHFKNNAQLRLEGPAIFQHLEPQRQLCMAILPDDDDLGLNIIGAFQQTNHRFLFDIAGSKLSFSPQTC